MEFNLYTNLFQYIDELIVSYVGGTAAALIGAISPVVRTGLVLSFIFLLTLILMGAIQQPLTAFLQKCAVVAIVTQMALSLGTYQYYIGDMVNQVPDALADSLFESSIGTGIGGILDAAGEAGLGKAGEAFELAGMFSAEGIAYLTVGTLMVLATAGCLAIGSAFIMLAKIVLSLLSALGPLFVVLLLFNSTRNFFAAWVNQVSTQTFLVLLFSAVFTFLIDLYGTFMDRIALGEQHVGYILGGVLCLSIGIIVTMIRLPSIAGALGQGLVIGPVGDLRLSRSSAPSAPSVSAGQDGQQALPSTRSGGAQIGRAQSSPASLPALPPPSGKGVGAGGATSTWGPVATRVDGGAGSSGGGNRAGGGAAEGGRNARWLSQVQGGRSAAAR